MLGSSEFELFDELLLAVVCIVLFESSGLDEEFARDDDEDVDVRLDDVEDVGLSLWYWDLRNKKKSFLN